MYLEHHTIVMVLALASKMLRPFHYIVQIVSVAIVSLSGTVQSSNSTRGSIVLLNSCSFPLYVEGVAEALYLKTTIWPNQQISHPYRLTMNGTGNSLKVASHKGSSEIIQIEYSACFENSQRILCTPLNQIFYDLSKINGKSQTEYGVRLMPSRPECVTINCPSGVQHCNLVYYSPHDDYATKACDVGTDLQ